MKFLDGIHWFVIACALVAALVPFPNLLPYSLVGLAVIWFATPATSKRDRRHAKRREERGY